MRTDTTTDQRTFIEPPNRRLDKAEVHYQDRAEDLDHICRHCDHFRGNDRCELVKGDISPDGWCEEWESSEAQDVTPSIATDPSISESQRRAMFAAAAGHSNLGIPQSVGREFANADPGGKLPAKAKDMSLEEMSTFRKLFNKFFREESREPEHREAQDDNWECKGRAASVAFTTSDGRVLLLRRSASDDNHAGEWSFPGGQADGDEDYEACARREAREEVGDCTFDGITELDRARTPNDYEHRTFIVPVRDAFEPTLSDEHDDWCWAPVTKLPEATHPGVKRTIDGIILDTADPTGKLSKTTRKDIGREGSEHREEMPESVFLGPNHTYPAKEKRDGEWKYTRNLLLAAARRARMEGEPGIARRADEIRAREFGAEDSTSDPNRRIIGSSPIERGRFVRDALRAVEKDMDPRDFRMLRDLMDRFLTEESEEKEHREAFDALALALDSMTAVVLAYDSSSRRLDSDGRMHVDEANICEARVDGYKGSEINSVMDGEPGWVSLEPERMYRVLRDPKELAKPETIKSANAIPILSTHLPTSASDHKFDETVGSTGTDARWEPPFIKNALVFWPQKAIDDIDDGTKRELSPGYRYRAEMKHGEYNGEPYEVIMRDIKFNHLAQVPKGRQGSKVVVPDADPDWNSWLIVERAITDLSSSVQGSTL